MKSKKFISQLDTDRIVEAIVASEKLTSGEIRVAIQHSRTGKDMVRLAQAKFRKLGMHRTRERNAVLIFISPEARQFAIIGDEGIHKKCGDTFWNGVVEEMTPYFRSGDFTPGLVNAVNVLGKALATHFPGSPDDSNELPNQVVKD